MRTWRAAKRGCRWRFWQPHGGHDRYASEVAEHICNGERVWIARGTPAGTSCLIGQEPATLMEVLDRLPGGLYPWVIEQTMTALNQAAPATHDHTPNPSADTNPEETLVLAEIHDLILEVLRLAHASDALEADLPINLKSAETAEAAELTLRDRAWTRLAS